MRDHCGDFYFRDSKGVVMTTTYDPRDKKYTDEHDLRLEMARVFDVCNECRQCVSLCPTFPALVSAVGSKKDADAGRLTPGEQDEVASKCFRCTMCSSVCPYTPDRHEQAIDFPRLIDRHRAMQKKNNQWPLRSTFHHLLLGRGWTIPRLGRQKFSSWFVRQNKSHRAEVASRVAVFPTCVVENDRPRIGKALIKVYEHNGIECSLVAPGRCCGAPALHHGEMKSFLSTAAKNVGALVDVVRQGKEIVLPNPTCYAVITCDYPHYLGTDEAALVASHTHDSSEYLVRKYGEQFHVKTDFVGSVATSIAHHVPLQSHSCAIGEYGQVLMSMTGTRVTDVVAESGREAKWGLHDDYATVADGLARALRQRIASVESDITVSSSPWGVDVLSAEGHAVLHPMEVLARAYGGTEETVQ